MRIAKVGLEHCGFFRSLVLDQLSGGLNLVLGETGSGKTTIRNGIGAMYYGFESIADQQPPSGAPGTSTGELTIHIGPEVFRLQRSADRKVSALDALVAMTTGATNRPLARQMGELSAADYYTFFNISFVDAPDIERRMSRSLLSRFSIGRGPTPWTSEAEYLRWRADATGRRDRLAEDESQYQRLLSRAERLKGEMSDAELNARQRLLDLEHRREHARTSMLAPDKEVATLQERLRELEGQLRLAESQRRSVRPGPIASVPNTAYSVGVQRIYSQLDAIQTEIRRTMVVRRDIRLRCQKIAESRQRLTDADHSFEHWRVRGLRRHLARLEQNLEAVAVRLGEFYEIAGMPAWAQAEIAATETPPDSDATQPWRWPVDDYLVPLEVSEIREQSRDARGEATDPWHWIRVDVEAVRRELDRYQLETRRERLQFEQADQRRCDRELTRRLVWLRRRRRQRLAELQRWDAAGYDLIRHGELRFLKYSRKHGYWEARRHFIGELQMPLQIEYTAEDPALDKRWQELQAEIARVQHRIGELEPTLREARRLWESLTEQYERMSNALNLEPVRRELLDVQRDLEALATRLHRLRDEVRRDDPLWDLKYDDLHEQASLWCRRLSGERLHRVTVDTKRQCLLALDPTGAERPFSSLSRDLQDLVCLSFCLAVAQHQSSHPLPLVLDNLFANLNSQRSQTVLDVLGEFSKTGQQIVLLASERQIGQRWLERTLHASETPSLAVFQLPTGFDTERRGQWPLVLQPLTVTKAERPIRVEAPEAPRPWPLITEQTPLAHLDLIEPEWLFVLSKHRVLLIADLLDLDPEALPQSLRMHGITVGQMDRWQSQVWLLCCIPGLRTYDVRLLVGSGISEAEELDAMSAGDVLRRLEIYLATEEGQRVMQSGTPEEQSRLHAWMNGLRDNRQTWAARRSDGGAGTRRQRWQRVRGTRRERAAEAVEPQSRPRQEQPVSPAVRLHESSRPKPGDSQSETRLTFYLNLDDSLERAPSIGPRMAERFADIGISNVRQFLNAPTDDMVRKLKLRRLDLQTLADWQRQAKLVCRIPNLRGHDAQLLVACEIHDPESLLGYSATELFAKVSPLAATKEGQRILRSSPAPDMDEIHDWLSWAKQHRTLQVA